MAETKSNTITMPEDECEEFDLVVNWLYWRRVVEIGDCTAEEKVILPRLRAYALADKYCMSRLQNAIVDSLKPYWKSAVIRPEYLTWAIENLPTGCALIDMMLDVFTFDVSNQNMGRAWREDMAVPITKDEFDQLFHVLANGGLSATFIDLINGWIAQEKSSATSPVERSGCWYHVHTDVGEKCPRSKENGD
jgi:hypothetical protein